MLPDQMARFSQSVIASALFLSNVHFWRTQNYFAPSSEEMPLLHIWSLAVEEQFYLLFPLVLFFAWKLGRRKLVILLALMALASLALSEWAGRTHATANFYLAPSRAWELFAGSLAAFVVRRNGVCRNELLAGLGLAAVAGSILLFHEGLRMPGLWGVIPVGGVVLLILYARRDTLAGRLLGTRALVAIGLISYSAYLWHQPLFAFARIRLIGEPGPGVMLGLSALALGLAAISWRFVEQPFRDRRRVLPGRGALLAVSAATLAALSLIGVLGIVAQGFPGRLSPVARALAETPRGDSLGCHNALTPQAIADGEDCRIGDRGRTPTWALLGDSHASALTVGLDFILKPAAKAATAMTGGWCVPLVGLVSAERPGINCADLTKAAYDAVARRAALDTDVLHAEWSAYVQGGRWGERTRAAYRFVESSPDGCPDGCPDDCPDHCPDERSGDRSGGGTRASLTGNADAFRKAVSHSFDLLAATGKRVIVVLPTPEFDFRVSEELARANHLGRPGRVAAAATTRTRYRARNTVSRAILVAAARSRGFEIVDPLDAFCPAETCDVEDDPGHALYTDGNHLSSYGSLRLAHLLERYLD